MASNSSNSRSHVAGVGERQPLLADSGSDTTANGDPPKAVDDDRPLPVGQILLLSLARLIDPVSYFAIFPFVNQMVYDTGDVKTSDVGFYSGLIESLFSLTQMCCMWFWARLADRYGRKPALVSGMCGLSLATVAFGFSRTIWQMIIFRCIAGVFSGNVLTVRTMIAEHCTPKTQAKGFSYYGAAYSAGVLLGPIIGGLGAKPATEFPSVFGRIQFFHDYPYALATLLSGFLGGLFTITSILFVVETLPVDRRTGKATAIKPEYTTKELVAAPGVKLVLWVYSHFMLLAFAFTALFPLIAFTPIPLGGYSFHPKHISYFLFGAALFQSLSILILFPPAQRKLGTINVLKLCAGGWAVVFAGPPLGNLLLRGGYVPGFWVDLCVVNFLISACAMAFVAIQLIINDVAPAPSTVSMINAFAISVVAGIRAFAPGLFASLFAEGVREQILKGHLVWLICIILSMALLAICYYLPASVDGKTSTTDTTREENES